MEAHLVVGGSTHVARGATVRIGSSKARALPRAPVGRGGEVGGRLEGSTGHLLNVSRCEESELDDERLLPLQRIPQSNACVFEALVIDSPGDAWEERGADRRLGSGLVVFLFLCLPHSRTPGRCAMLRMQ